MKPKTMNPAFAALAVGDAVWLASRLNRTKGRIEIVTKVTDTQLILRSEGLGTTNRYYRANGRRVGSDISWITGKASPEEVIQYHRERDFERKQSEDREAEQRSIETQRLALQSNFVDRSIWVAESQEHPGRWTLTLDNLDAEQVKMFNLYVQKAPKLCAQG